MKTNFLKYIFMLVIITTVAYSVYALYFKDKNKPQEEAQEEVEEVETKKDLRLGISNFDSINPLISNNKEILNLDRLIFEPLMTLTSDYKLEKCLASDWSKVNDTSYIIKIDSDKKWHDGSPLMAKDVQFTIDRLKEGNSVYSYNVEKVNGVEIIDGTTIKIYLSEPVEFFEYNLTFPILSNNYYLGEDMYATTKVPIGTGMYKIASISSSKIELKKNDKWWNIGNQNSKIETIDVKIFTEMGEVYNSFKLGNLDLITSSNLNLENYIGTIGYSKYEYKGRSYDYLALNCQNQVLQEACVRRAIAYGIDKANIVSSVFTNTCYTSDFPLDYDCYLYTEPESIIRYNQEQAKKELLDNGWQYKNNKWQKKDNNRTKAINLTLTVNTNDEKRVKVAENIKNQLDHIGIRVTIRKVSESSYNSILQNKNYEMILTGVYNSYNPSLTTFIGENNLQNYSNNDITRLLMEVKNITNQEVLKEKYEKIIEICNYDMPFISLYRDKSIVAKNQKMSGEIKPNNFFSYYNFYTWGRF